MLLEEKYPPLTIMYIHQVWLEQSPTESEMKVGLKALINAVLKYQATSSLFLYDVCKVISSIENKLRKSANVDAVFPSEHDFNPLINDAVVHHCVDVIIKVPQNKKASSLYMYAHALKMFKHTFKFKPQAQYTGNTTVLEKIMTRFSCECKFKQTGDLFIWIILYLKLPPWTILAQQKNEAPYTLISNHFKELTNNIVHPLTKESVEDQLEKSTGLDQFCIIATLALELTNHASTIVINHALLQANPNVPTFAAITKPYTSSTTILFEYGYVYQNVFFVFSNPFFAVQQWSLAVDTASAFSEVCVDDSIVSSGNPFLKFVH